MRNALWIRVLGQMKFGLPELIVFFVGEEDLVVFVRLRDEVKRPGIVQ